MFGLQARWTSQDHAVYVLRRIEGHASMSESGADKEFSEMRRGRMTLHAQPITKLCEFLTSSVHAVVMDETEMVGRYDFELPYQPGQPEVTSKALNEIGLEIVKARRAVRMQLVTPEKAQGPIMR